jgi:hypothetical protein
MPFGCFVGGKTMAMKSWNRATEDEKRYHGYLLYFILLTLFAAPFTSGIMM